MSHYIDWLDAQHDAQRDLTAASDEALADQLRCTALLETVPWFRHPDKKAQPLPPPQTSIAAWPRLESNCEITLRMEKLNVASSRMISAWLGGGPLEAMHRTESPPPPPPIGGWRADATLLSLARIARARQPLRAAIEAPASACGAKLRGATRRTIGKQSRRETRERARRLAPAVLAEPREAAARRGRHALHDAGLAALLDQGLSFRAADAGALELQERL